MNRLLLFFISFLFVVGCRVKSRTPEYTDINIDQGILDRYDYKEGTYWVYEDSATAELDSFYIYAARNSGSYGDKGFLMNKYLLGMIDYGSSRPNDSFSFVLVDKSVLLNFQKNLAGTFVGFTLTFYPFVYPKYNTEGVGSMPDFITLYPTYTVKGINYTNVLNVHFHDSPAFPGFSCEAYLCEYQGIVKMKITSTSTGFFKNYELVRTNRN